MKKQPKYAVGRKGAKSRRSYQTLREARAAADRLRKAGRKGVYVLDTKKGRFA